MLEFDKGKHEYRWDGRTVPNVTTILKPLVDLSGIPFNVLERKREIGTMVHLICELFDKDDLVTEAVPEVYLPYFKGYQKFVHDHHPDWVAIEQPVYHKSLRYAGTPDRVGTIGTLDGIFVVDIKTTADIYASVGPQITAYIEACRNNGLLDKKGKAGRAVLWVGENDYRLHVLPPPEESRDRDVFLSCLSIFNYLESKK